MELNDSISFPCSTDIRSLGRHLLDKWREKPTGTWLLEKGIPWVEKGLNRLREVTFESWTWSSILILGSSAAFFQATAIRGSVGMVMLGSIYTDLLEISEHFHCCKPISVIIEGVEVWLDHIGEKRLHAQVGRQYRLFVDHQAPQGLQPIECIFSFSQRSILSTLLPD